jgi:large subunit ribosomal protein L15
MVDMEQESQFKLANLQPPRGAKRTKKRLGRGNASGWGRTAGRGEKGQFARSGGTVRPGFEGGQMPIYRRLPKFGFVSRQQILGTNRFTVVNLSVLDKFSDGSLVDADALAGIGCGAKAKNRAGIKVLASGKLTKKLNLKVNAISAAAKARIEELGGNVELLTRESAVTKPAEDNKTKAKKR